jgi:hypothetical protein
MPAGVGRRVVVFQSFQESHGSASIATAVLDMVWVLRWSVLGRIPPVPPWRRHPNQEMESAGRRREI